MHSLKLVRSIAAVASIGFLTSSINAAMVVDWGGEYTTSASSYFAGQGSAVTQGGFSSGNPLSLTPTSNYTPSATSANFSGQVTRGGAGGTAAGYVRTIAGGDQIVLKKDGESINGLLLWRQTDFLNGHNTGNVAFDNTSTVTMNINTFALFSAGQVVIRLQGGSQDGYYISQQTPFNGTGLKSANLTSLTWLQYNPASSLTSVGSSVNLLQGGIIPNVTEVGFFTTSAGGVNAFRLDSFEVTAVPEPQAAALLMTALAGTLGFRRRNSRALPQG